MLLLGLGQAYLTGLNNWAGRLGHSLLPTAPSLLLSLEMPHPKTSLGKYSPDREG